VSPRKWRLFDTSTVIKDERASEVEAKRRGGLSPSSSCLLIGACLSHWDSEQCSRPCGTPTREGVYSHEVTCCNWTSLPTTVRMLVCRNVEVRNTLCSLFIQVTYNILMRAAKPSNHSKSKLCQHRTIRTVRAGALTQLQV
jgi:hypothetical protein